MADANPYVLEDIDVIIQRMVDYFRTAQSKITDFNEGSEVRNLLSSVGVSAYEARYYADWMLRMGYPHTSEGIYLDMLGVLVNCYRQSAVKATGTVTFGLVTAKAYDIQIPSGTVITIHSDSNLQFETTAAATLPAGSTSVDVAAQCTTGGTDGKVSSGVIDTLISPFEDLTVTNTSAFTGGQDSEEDGQFRARIIEAGKGTNTGSLGWYKTIASGVAGVHDVAVQNNLFGSSYNVKLFVNATSKPTVQTILDAVSALFKEDDSSIGGVKVLVAAPNFISTNIASSVTIAAGYTWALVSANIEANIACYFNGGTTTYGVEYPGLTIGDNIIVSTIALIIANTEGVQDYTITSPISNVIMGQTDAGMLGTVALTQA